MGVFERRLTQCLGLGRMGNGDWRLGILLCVCDVDKCSVVRSIQFNSIQLDSLIFSEM